MEYEKCYAFEPSELRPTKRRKPNQTGLQASWHLRRTAYQHLWAKQQQRIDEVLIASDETTVEAIESYLSGIASTPEASRLPIGIIVAGPGAASHTSLLSQLSTRVTKSGRRVFVSLSAALASNLKTLLKTLIKNALSRDEGVDEDAEDEIESKPRKGPRLLNYDLQILYDHVRERNVEQVVVAFQDSEAFDGSLLSETIELLSCWLDRIPFVCLFGIATSVDSFQSKLSKAALRCLHGTQFDLAPASDVLEAVFDTLYISSGPVWLGSSLSAAMLERQTDYIQSIQSFSDSARYAYMSTFYANALSIFLIESTTFEDFSKDHFKALRNLDSFRGHARNLLEAGQTATVRRLLDSDEDLLQYVKELLQDGRAALVDELVALDVISALQNSLSSAQVSTRSSLYVQAMAGKLSGSTLLRTLLLSLRKSPSNTLVHVINAISVVPLPEATSAALETLAEELQDLMASHKDANGPFRSEDDVKNSTLRTTVVAQKVELSKQKATFSKQDAAYTRLVRRLSEQLEAYFTDTLIDPKDLVFNEIFVYDLKSPHREIFTPKPRHAIERALAAPHDYLDCACCAPQKDEEDETTLSAAQPATAILYQLYLESGTLINASDLWSAFQAVLSDASGDDEQKMALFQRALAELRYLGLVKSTRKKADHVAKVAWRGL